MDSYYTRYIIMPTNKIQYPLEVKDVLFRARFIRWIDICKGLSLFACSDGHRRVINESKLSENGIPVGRKK